MAFSNTPFISDYYSKVEEHIRNEVSSQSDSFILSQDEGEYSLYLFERYSLQEIQFDESRDNHIEKTRKKKVGNDYGRKFTREYLWVRIKLPVVPTDKIRETIELIPSTFSLSPPAIEYQEGYLITEVPAEESDVGRAISQIRQGVERRNNDIEKHNQQLKRFIREIITWRKKKVQDEDEVLEKITKTIAVPLKIKSDPASVVPASLSVRQTIRPVMPPKPNPPVKLELERSKFNAIVELINNSCLLFERIPLTFVKMQEEELRDVILSNLNSVFQGDAVGEAFSKFGKTDIFLTVDKGGIFIAECKFWKGTWRNCYGVAIFFSRNKGFSQVLASLKDNIPTLQSYVNGFKIIDESHFVARHHLTEDENKLIEIHVLAYNLYAERAK